ncbi:MAG: phosphatidate cytidylyltransferase [Planctomycetota bacterium]
MSEGKAKKLALRVGYGFALILALVGIFLVDLFSKTNYATTLLAVGVTGLGLWECYSLCERKGLRPWKVSGAVAGGLLIVGQWLDLQIPTSNPVSITWAVLLGFFVLLALLALTRRSRATAIEDMGVTLFGILYVWFLIGFAFWMRNDPSLPGSTGLWVTLMMVGTAKSGDIAAYFTGSFLGRHRLAPPISPNKTLEGSVGGLLASVAFALVFSQTVPECKAFMTVPMGLVFGVSIGILSQTGDLFESLLKRTVHVKDSGALIPEFGGILDMLDGLLFASPAAYFLVVLFH